MTKQPSFLLKLACCLVVLGLGVCLLHTAVSEARFVSRASPPEPFLVPPFYGTKRVTCVYDHEYPVFEYYPSGFNGRGLQVPANYEPPAHTLHYDGVIYYSGTRSYYDGHSGIDYGAMYYKRVRASANGRVIYAGWENPRDHKDGCGLFVRIRHDANGGYYTTYCHLSIISVDTETEITDALEGSGRIIGISGNTGASSAVHLHFEVEPPEDMYSINPYGWIGEPGTDPWENWYYDEDHHGYPSYDLWAHYPSISNSEVYPSGDPIPAPPDPNPAAPGVVLVDESSDGFAEDPQGCWTSAAGGYENSLRYTTTFTTAQASGFSSCTGTWHLPALPEEAGAFDVYVYIPSGHATSNGAIYTIRHQGGSSQAIVAQAEFLRSGGHWAYLGKYAFDLDGTEFVRLTNVTDDEGNGREVAAAAVMLVPVGVAP